MRYYHKLLRNNKISATCVSSVLIIMGCTLFIYTTVTDLREMTESRLKIGTELINNALKESHEALKQAESRLTSSCSENMPIMNGFVNLVPALQSFNIENNDNIVICSTNSKLLGLNLNLSSFKDSDFLLIKSDIITPGHPLVVLKRHIEGKTLFVTIAGSNIYSFLDVIKNIETFAIETKDLYLDNLGNLIPNDGRYPFTYTSDVYQFKLSTRITLQDYINYGLEEKSLLLILFILLAISNSILAYLKTRNPSSTHKMKKALKNNEFIPYVQPIMNAEGKLAGLEVLMRWIKPYGMIAPDLFIPAAEKSGLIIPMTEQLIENVAEQFNPIANKLPTSFHIGLNISAKHFDVSHQESLIKCCEKFKNTSTGQHCELLIEITERELITDYKQTNHTISSLQAMGAKLAIDDFGTGHSTLDYIKNLSIDTIKIDKSYVDLIETGAITAQLVDNIIDLSQRLNVSVIAEGVESALQAQYLSERGVDYLQGYYFSKPMPIDDFINQYLK